MLLNEEFGPPALHLLGKWLKQERELVAPPLFHAEVTSIIRERSFRGEMSDEDAAEAVARSLLAPVDTWRGTDALQPRAFELAVRFNQPKAYDAQYLALADLLGCELWTADRRLANSVAAHLPWVHYVGEAA